MKVRNKKVNKGLLALILVFVVFMLALINREKIEKTFYPIKYSTFVDKYPKKISKDCFLHLFYNKCIGL